MNLEKIEIFFFGKWTEGEIKINEVVSTRVVDDNLEKLAKETWDEMLQIATTNNQQLWDSEVYRFEKSETDRGKLSLQFSTIPFSVRLGMNKYTDQVKSLGVDYAPKALFASVLVETSDKQFVFIEKSNKYFTNKKNAWVGGVLSKSEKEVFSGLDLIDLACTEVMEELGVGKIDINNVALLAGYLTENWNTCLLFSVKLSLSALGVEQAFSKQNDGEVKNLIFLDKNNLSTAIDIFEDKDQIKFTVLDLV